MSLKLDALVDKADGHDMTVHEGCADDSWNGQSVGNIEDGSVDVVAEAHAQFDCAEYSQVMVICMNQRRKLGVFQLMLLPTTGKWNLSDEVEACACVEGDVVGTHLLRGYSD